MSKSKNLLTLKKFPICYKVIDAIYIDEETLCNLVFLCLSTTLWLFCRVVYVCERGEREREMGKLCSEDFVLGWVFVLLCILCANASCSSTKIRSLRIMFTGNWRNWFLLPCALLAFFPDSTYFCFLLFHYFYFFFFFFEKTATLLIICNRKYISK